MFLRSWWKRKAKEKNPGGNAGISDEVLATTREKFRQHDTNSSGSIDRDELAALLRALNLENLMVEANAKPAKGKGKAPASAPVKPSAKALPPADPIVEGDLSTEDAKDGLLGTLLRPDKLATAVATQLVTAGLDSKDSVWSPKDATLTKEGMSW